MLEVLKPPMEASMGERDAWTPHAQFKVTVQKPWCILSHRWFQLVYLTCQRCSWSPCSPQPFTAGLWCAHGVPHVPNTFPSLSPRHGQRLELADKQTKGHFSPGVREWLLSPLPVLQRCSTAHRCLPGFPGTHSPAWLWQHLSLQDVAKHRIWLRICLWSCPFSIIQSVKLNQTFPPE